MRVIICDDHAVFADSLSLVLSDAGHTVVGVVYSPRTPCPCCAAGAPTSA
ncbi:response regulator [Actinomadura graeca]|uniref:Response regulator n=1 Tax=Actinomadura graeca TaxID=2750812 RepID=A0ABX8QT27_9ACTN|nr:response regulator [Actinomadura graeca]QXJ21902.1 response regulator [Actinomadura graeca]